MHQCIRLFYFGMTLYMFRTVFPSIISSSGLYIQQQAFVKEILLYVQSLTADDGRKDRPKHVECHFKNKIIWYSGASSWFYYRNLLRFTSIWTSNLCLGAFEKLRRATVSSVMSVRLPVSVRSSVRPRGTTWSHWTNFYEMWVFLKNLSRQVKFH